MLWILEISSMGACWNLNDVWRAPELVTTLNLSARGPGSLNSSRPSNLSQTFLISNSNHLFVASRSDSPDSPVTFHHLSLASLRSLRGAAPRHRYSSLSLISLLLCFPTDRLFFSVLDHYLLSPFFLSSILLPPFLSVFIVIL